jgi:2,4-dienoyl-CoA reductase-like NADH-dependent reductase (Old Yellow Enzyme family)
MKIFEPLKIKNTILKNRIVFPPTCTCMGVDSDEALEYYTVRAKGGAGLLIVEGTNINSFKSEGFFESMKRLAQSIKHNGAVAILQLTAPTSFNGENVWVSDRLGARAVSLREIDGIVGGFAYAANMAKKAGFDGIDVHGAHGFFFNKFFPPTENKRNDEFGGSLENRMRFGLNVVSCIRKSVDDDFLIFYRHTPVEGIEGGYTIEDSLYFSKMLETAGVDVMDISPGKSKFGEVAEYAEQFKKKLNIPVMTVNGFNIAANAEYAVSTGKCDLVGICRGIIADPDLPKKIQTNHEEKIIKCTECNKGCYGNINEGKPVKCVRDLDDLTPKY